MNKRQIIAALVEKIGAKIDENDPVFLLVELILIMIQNALDEVSVKLKNTFISNMDNYDTIANESITKFAQKNIEFQETIETIHKPWSLITNS